MIDRINATQPVNIISIEDPIEYTFQPKKGFISQREIGLDVNSFADALRAAVPPGSGCDLHRRDA